MSNKLNLSNYRCVLVVLAIGTDTTNILFLVQDPIEDSTLHVVLLYPQSSSVCDNDFLCCLSFMVSCRMSFNLSDVISWFSWGSAFSAWITQKMLCPSQCIISGGTQCLYELSLVMLTLITWLRSCVLGFFTVKLLFFPLWLISMLWQDNFETMQTIYFSHFYLLILAPLMILACNNYYCGVCQVVIFYFHHSIYIY